MYTRKNKCVIIHAMEVEVKSKAFSKMSQRSVFIDPGMGENEVHDTKTIVSHCEDMLSWEVIFSTA